jgi:hypothetical protein
MKVAEKTSMAESFFAALKNERVHRTQYPTREHARRDSCEVHRILVQFEAQALRATVPDPTTGPRGIPGTAVRSVN